MSGDLGRFLAAIWGRGDVREVRAPKAGREGTLSGYFDSPDALARAVEPLDGKANLYVTLNPVNPALSARATNRIKSRAESTSADKDIVGRRWLYVDIDPVKPTGISSTEAEREAALATARGVMEHLEGLGWPPPIVAMSGNGYMLLYRIDLPNDAASTRLVEAVLFQLAESFTTETVKIDRSVGNASRIGALIGTIKLKGDDTPDRPHRRSMLVSVPDSIDTVGRDQLEALAPAQTAQESPKGDGGGRMPAGWVLKALDANGIAHGEPKEADSDGIVWIDLVICPYHPEVADAPCGVGEASDGRATAKCFHDRGAGKGWQEFKSVLGLKVGPTLSIDGVGDGDGPGPADDSWERLAGDALHGGRFAASVRGKVLYDTTAKAWYIWAGHHWKRDGRQAVKRLYRQYLAERMVWAMGIPDEDARRTAMSSVMAASRTDSRINGALAMASVDLSVESSIWDRDPWLLGVNNGVVDLRTGLLRDGKPGDHLTKSSRVDFVPGAPAVRWARFLREVFLGDDELITWLQLLLGYACIGTVEAEVWAMFHGGGSNGKSTLLKAVRNVLGTYATTSNPDAILTAQRNRGSGPDEEVAALRGARLVTASEAEHDIVLSSAKAKKLAGKDTLRASRKFEHDMTWEPTHLLIVAVNQLPQLNDSSHGAWRRIVLVPFLATFGEDNRLEATLEAESEGILEWLVTGALRYATARTLDPKPVIVVKATAEYRESEDHIARFINDCVTHGPGEKVKASLAYRAYADWCSGVAILPHGARWSHNVFGRDFAKKASDVLGVTVSKAEDRNGSFWYHDVVVTLPPMGPTINVGGPPGAASTDRNPAPDTDGGTRAEEPSDSFEGVRSGHETGQVREPAGVRAGRSLTTNDFGMVLTETPAGSRSRGSKHEGGSPAEEDALRVEPARDMALSYSDLVCGHPWAEGQRRLVDGRPTSALVCRRCGAVSTVVPLGDTVAASRRGA